MVSYIIPSLIKFIIIITSRAANCGYPDLLLWRITNDSVPDFEGYDGLPIDGSTVRFSCPNELALIGPNSATCTENGKWKLSPISRPTCVQSQGYIFMLT